MDNAQFFMMMKEARKLSGKSILDVCIAMHKSQSTVINMMCGQRNYQLSKIFEFLHAIDCEIVVNDNHTVVIELTSSHETMQWVKTLYEGMNSYQLADILHCAQGTALNMFKRGDMKLSIFLTVINTHHWTVNLQPVDIANIASTSDCDF